MHYLRTLVLIFVLAAFAVPSAALAASGSIDADTLTANYGKITLAGEADVETVRLFIKDEKGKTVYKSKDIEVEDGEWESKVSKKLKVGEYEVSLRSKDGKKLIELASSELKVLSKKTKKTSGTLAVSMVPLLSGGTAAPGSSVPVSYIQVKNTGSTTVSIDGFTLKENGSAPDTVVTGFSVSDDKGGSRATIEGTFKKGLAFVPLKAAVAPGQLRIFTIKAILSNSFGSALGTQLKIDVAGVETKAKGVKAAFPLRGTTFVLGY